MLAFSVQRARQKKKKKTKEEKKISNGEGGWMSANRAWIEDRIRKRACAVMNNWTACSSIEVRWCSGAERNVLRWRKDKSDKFTARGINTSSCWWTGTWNRAKRGCKVSVTWVWWKYRSGVHQDKRWAIIDFITASKQLDECYEVRGTRYEVPSVHNSFVNVTLINWYGLANHRDLTFTVTEVFQTIKCDWYIQYSFLVKNVKFCLFFQVADRYISWMFPEMVIWQWNLKFL